MATTTNYGWTTPDDTDLVKDGAAAIRTLGSSVDTTLEALNPSTTLGDIEYRSATADTNTRLGIGSTGQLLTVAGGVPTWADAPGGGKVLQVIQDTVTGAAGTTSTTMADTNLDVTITPSSASSKILIMANINGINKGAANGANGVNLEIDRGGSRIYYAADGITYTSIASNNFASATLVYLDSPATTSATTYKIRFSTVVSGQFAGINDYRSSNTVVSSMIVMEIGA